MPEYILPAEWEKQTAVWLAWPQNASDWPGKFSPIPWVYGEMIRKLSAHQTVGLIVPDDRAELKARNILYKAGADLAAVEFYHAKTDRSWTRDYCPAFVRNSTGTMAALSFAFNGWAKYRTHTQDALVAGQVAKWASLPEVIPTHKGGRVVLEGGGIDVNGQGLILVTEECFLHPKKQIRNPGFDRGDYEDIFRRYFGTTETIWLGNGIAGDDTHGHVDDVCRFVNPGTVVLVQEDNQADPNHRPLRDNMDRLKNLILADGGKLNVVALPMPEPLYYEGFRLPASYANFLIANQVVLVPTFNDPHDRLALNILAELFPGRAVTGIHAVDLVLGLGSVHCLTHEQASA